MKIKDILLRDPATHPLVNQGQARIADTKNEKALEELRWELSSFVCEGQYAEGIERIVRSYLQNQEKPSQRGAWVNGFFGSGKSHLLKMLAHFWQNTRFSDGATARSLVPSMPSDLRELLRELDTAGKRSGGLLAAAGPMPAGVNERVRLTVLNIIFHAVGLPESYPAACFCLWLKDQGFYDSVKASLNAEGKDFDRELRNLYVSGPIARAVLKCDSQFARNEIEARETIRSQYPLLTTDIDSTDFLLIMKAALQLVGRDGRLPCTVLVLDEVQQYIGPSEERSTLVSEVAETVSKELGSQVMIVGAGQNALTDVRLLNKLLDRFTIRVPLSDADVETVTRKVLLQKKPEAVAEVQALLSGHAGEISRELHGTRIAERAEDRDTIVDDYPVLPVRRRFWENCFRQIDAAGTSSQLRSQLKIIHDAVARLSNRELGAVVPGDELYEALAPDMVTTGVLANELSERILRVGKDKGLLAQRICGLVFLIGKLEREGGPDIGVRASREHIADLLVDDLTADNGKLRAQVESTLTKLVDSGELMEIHDEYRLQTDAARQWDAEFRARQAKLNNDEPAIQFLRDTFLNDGIGKILRSIKPLQGLAKEPRQLLTYRDQTPPTADGSGIPVWIRDQWAGSESDMVKAARSAGSQSPIIYVFVQRKSADDLRRLIVETEAARQTVEAKGGPSADQEAVQHMEGRRAKAESDRDLLIADVVGSAKVFQGGGNEVLTSDLAAKVREATDASLIRLFPRFKEADSAAWEAVLKRARAGADHPFQALGYNDATEKHPVCQEVIAKIGAGKLGGKIRDEFGASPYGWPQDAIDAALIALHRSQKVTATLNGAPIAIGQLDQNRISKAEFRVEYDALSIEDRLAVRGLFMKVGVIAKSGEESLRASEFLAAMINLALSAGGEPPLQTVPHAKDIEDLKSLIGNAQLVAIRQNASDFEKKITEWSKASALVAQRRPAWQIVERMAHAAHDLDDAKPLLEQIEAIRKQRLLLAPTDPVSPIRVQLAEKLRECVNKASAELSVTYTQAMAMLNSSEVWEKLEEADRTDILRAVGLAVPAEPDLSTDESLLQYLEARPLATVRTEIAAIAGRTHQAIERAAKRLEPKTTVLVLDHTTLHTEPEVDAWLARQRIKLVEAVKKGPVLIN